MPDMQRATLEVRCPEAAKYMKTSTLESSREKQLLCIRLAGVKLRKLRGGISLVYNTVN